MRKTIALATTAIIMLALAACGVTGGSADTTETSPACVASGGTSYGDLLTCTIELPDTRLVTCLIFDGYNSGGIDCDWAHVSGADMGSVQ